MKRSLIFIIFIWCAIVSCTKENYMPDTITNTPAPYTPPAVATPDTNSIKYYLALGDSYTIGQSVTAAERFPTQTVKYLNDQGVHFASPEIIAQTGWTTDNLLNSLFYTAPARKVYDIVTLLIGVNNQYQHRPQKEYAEQFVTLLAKAVHYAGNNKKRVIVLSIPDYSVTPFAAGSDRASIAAEIDAFNTINKQIADSTGTNYLDITGYSRLAATDFSLIASDGLHPSIRN